MNVLEAILEPKMAQKGLKPTDGVADMTHISDIDVAGVNTNLKVRFGRNEIYTYTGTILIAVNPYRFLKIYETETMQEYQAKKMGELPPHIFATAQAAYFNIQHSSRNQSCVISGESGAGKTETTKFILQYLCAVSSATNQWVERQIMECNTILEAFGNARTVRNDNSSRFGKFMQVCFDDNVEIKGMIVQEYLLEQSRITFQSKDERNYHVFYQLVRGADKEQFLLAPMESYQYLNQSGCYKLTDVDDGKAYEELRMALTVLNVDDDVQDGIFSLVSAVLLIGNIQFRDMDGEAVSLTDADRKTVASIAQLLKIKPEQVSDVLTQRQIIVKGTTTTIPLKLTDARENRHAMAKALYSRTFTWLIDQINQTTNPGQSTKKFIGVLDIFGFENFGINSFEQLCINFTNEKLHYFFNQYVFALEQAEYTREGIRFDHIKFTDNTACLELIEKPPACVLRLIDEECRFPKGTDQSYLEKQHAALAAHPNYIKGDLKARWDIEFGIRHFAGPVTYTVAGFLDKNKDVMQDQLFEYMRGSSNPFIRDVPKFQDMLSIERKLVMTSRVEGAAAASGRRGTSDERLMTNKQKPTVADTFRRQLASLVEVLEETTPWYVRCIKPNTSKAPKEYDDALVIAQLNYSGMLDVVRIRKEGFPVHVPAETFMHKYAAMAQVMRKELSKDPKEAVRQILTYVKAPPTEWQIGKTKVFLRNSVFEPLEESLRKLLWKRVVLIQKVYRGHRERVKYKRTLAAVVLIQARVRGLAKRWRFLAQRRAAIRIQAWVRGCFQREVYKEMLKKKRREEEERKRKERERIEKEMREKGEALMEESFLSAQKELYAMAKMAELRAADAKAKQAGGAVNLDKMFASVADDRGASAQASTYMKQVDAELDRLFSQAAPKPDGKRTIRRKKRVEKKMLAVEEKRDEVPPEEEVNPADYAMIKFAEKYFNDHPKSSSGTLSTRKGKPIDDPMPKQEMIVYTKQASMATSLVHLHNPENVALAVSIFKDLAKHMKGELKPDQVVLSIQSIVAYCLERIELRDEIYCQLMRQTTNNPNPDAQLRGWQILAVCSLSFSPSNLLYKYFRAFVKLSYRDTVVGPYAKWINDYLTKMKLAGHRRLPPSQAEIEAIFTRQPIICRFYFLDGKAKAVGIMPSWTAQDAIDAIASKIGLRITEGWALFESTPQHEHFIRKPEFIGDILADWEVNQRSSMQMTGYQTVSRKGGFTSAMGGGDAKFVFRKRLFTNPREISTDPVEYSLLYAQAVHSVVRADEFPVSERVALQLAGLQAQVVWGEPDGSKLSRYDEIDAYLSWRIRALGKGKSREDWVQQLFQAHKDFGAGKSDLQAKVLYLTAVQQYPLYGGAFFDVQYKGFWSFPNRLLLCIDVMGFKFVNMKTKDVLATFQYDQLKNMEVNSVEQTITFNMNVTSPEDTPSYMFFCTRMDDVANLVASYSPAHRNWKQVGVATTHVRKTTEDDKARLLQEVQRSRVQIAQAGMLLRPPDKGFMATTLRRGASASKLKQVGSDSDFEKTFDVRYWSYSKSKLTQPLTVMASEETTDIALKTFNSLLIFAGLAREGGFEEADDVGFTALVQNVIGQCLEKEDVCNEFYLQLIKQTSDQPDPDGKINQQNWRFFALSLGVVVPRNKLLLNYIQCHLRRCAVEGDSEEAKFAQFCMQCLNRTLENKNRKYPPSRQEITCIVKRAAIYARFYFMDNEYRALTFDAASSTAEVVSMIKERIGLGPNVQGFSLFEVFGNLERNMLPWEKVADAMYKWEKYAKTTSAQKELRLTFKKRLFIGPFNMPTTKVEFDLLFHQAMDDVRNDRVPITSEEACQLAALRAQVELGDHDPAVANYEKIIEGVLPKYLWTAVEPADIAGHHAKLKSKDAEACNILFLKLVMAWPLYGATTFEVMQTYTQALPKNLWLAVNEHGIHIMRRRAKEPMMSYGYRDIVNYSPSLRNLMIVTESLTRGTKFVFTTTQASQIAHLIKDYTHLLIQKKADDKDLPTMPPSQKSLPTSPPPAAQKSLTPGAAPPAAAAAAAKPPGAPAAARPAGAAAVAPGAAKPAAVAPAKAPSARHEKFGFD